MNKAYLLIGGNIGNREAYLSAAREQIQKFCGDIVSQSSLYQTAAWGLQDQDAFLNQAVEIETALNPHQLLYQLLEIEESLGRKREIKYGPRVIDIDILLFAGEIIKEDGLTIPHPQMQNRRFVLVPLSEIAPEEIHPVLESTIAQLLRECPDNLTVQKFQ
jgi:2-amino-4-hydroxy-6-hydroxymethyldihydropteridine diphosphokinase